MTLIKGIDRQIELTNRAIGEAKVRLIYLQNKKHLMQTLPDICPSCKGTGEERYTDAAGSRDWRDCSMCDGVGRVDLNK